MRILVNALMRDSRTKILSTPSVLATDNRPARIQVGSEEPIATGSVVESNRNRNDSRNWIRFKYDCPVSKHRQNRNHYSTSQF